MQNTDKTSSVENVPSPSLPTRRAQVGHLLIAALAALGAGLAATLAVLMTLVAVVLFWGEIGQNFFGPPLGWAMLVTALSLLADFSLYGLILCLAYRVLLPKEPVVNAPAGAQGRRQLLARAGVAVLSVGAGAGTLGLVRSYLNNDNFTAYDGTETFAHNGVTAPITPNSDHYVVIGAVTPLCA